MLKTRPSCARQGDFGVVVDQSGQDDEDYQGVLGCTELYCTVLGTSGLQ